MNDDTTIFYLSGELKGEKIIKERVEDFRNVGILLSYWTLQSKKGMTYDRMKNLLEKGE